MTKRAVANGTLTIGMIMNAVLLFIAGAAFALPSDEHRVMSRGSIVAMHDEHTRNTVTAPLCQEEDASGANDSVCTWDANVSGLADGGKSWTAFTVDACVKVFAYTDGTFTRYDECDE